MLYMKTSYKNKFDSIASSSPEGFLPNIHHKKNFSSKDEYKKEGKNRSSLGCRPIRESLNQALVKSNEMPKYTKNNSKQLKNIGPFKK